MKELYTSDYIVKNHLDRDNLNYKIRDLLECKDTLYDLIGNNKEINYIYDIIINKVNELKLQLDQKYPEGVYKLRRDIASIKKNTLIKREEGDSCENCIFKKIPCLGPKYDYGCYKANKYSPNANPAYGELISTGHFVEYKN